MAEQKGMADRQEHDGWGFARSKYGWFCDVESRCTFDETRRGALRDMRATVAAMLADMDRWLAGDGE
jgi:hypothetical protein